MSEYKELDLGLTYDVAIGLRGGSTVHREVTLMRGNGVSEKVFLKKNSDKPYTWIGNVLTVAFKEFAGEEIAKDARIEFVQEGSVTIPNVIQKMPLADANSSLLEVHRRLWQNLVPKQTCLCKFCGNDFVMDIDLNRIQMSEENVAFMEQLAENPAVIMLNADLLEGYDFVPFQRNGDKGMKHEELAGKYNRLVYRVPTLKDAIRNEKYMKERNEVTFWRRIAYDCLEAIQYVENINTDQEEVIRELPKDVNTLLGTKLYDSYLGSKDLKIVRETLREKLPVMPFGYTETCPSCERQTPVAIEATSFFSA